MDRLRRASSQGIPHLNVDQIERFLNDLFDISLPCGYCQDHASTMQCILFVATPPTGPKFAMNSNQLIDKTELRFKT